MGCLGRSPASRTAFPSGAHAWALSKATQPMVTQGCTSLNSEVGIVWKFIPPMSSDCWAETRTSAQAHGVRPKAGTTLRPVSPKPAEPTQRAVFPFLDLSCIPGATGLEDAPRAGFLTAWRVSQTPLHSLFAHLHFLPQHPLQTSSTKDFS